jgi:hypothetical protein
MVYVAEIGVSGDIYAFRCIYVEETLTFTRDKKEFHGTIDRQTLFFALVHEGQ